MRGIPMLDDKLSYGWWGTIQYLAFGLIQWNNVCKSSLNGKICKQNSVILLSYLIINSKVEFKRSVAFGEFWRSNLYENVYYKHFTNIKIEWAILRINIKVILNTNYEIYLCRDLNRSNTSQE